MAVALGKKIPDFEIETTGGAFGAGEMAGPLVLYFYPKDHTPGCTTESEGFRDAHAALRRAKATVLGVSRDTLASHERFRAALDLPFHLGSDADEALCEAFGVIKLKNLYGRQVRGIERSTFVIGADRTLLRAWRGVKVPGHVDEVLAFVKSL